MARNDGDPDGPEGVGDVARRGPASAPDEARAEATREGERGRPLQATPASGRAEASAAANSLAALAEALGKGTIDAVRARSELLDTIVREQLPRDASQELIDSIREEVENLLADDPTLARLLGQ